MFAWLDYKSIIYTNKRTKQMVVSFQGIRLQLVDFLSVIENNVKEKMSQSFVNYLVQNKNLRLRSLSVDGHSGKASPPKKI